MKLLVKTDYHKSIKLLSKVSINNYFARAVAEKKVDGKIYVDDVSDPKTFYILHPYGISLLLGASGNKDFNQSFRDYALNTNRSRNEHEWMQAFPEKWHEVLSDLFDGSMVKSSEKVKSDKTNIIELNTRVNFKFNKDKYLFTKPLYRQNGISIVRTDLEIFKNMKGAVVPFRFWDNAEDFYKNGVGFSVYYEGNLASTAYSAFIFDNILELGIETMPEFRGKGLAGKSCSALIDYCLQNGYEPVWSCRFENTASYNLAQKLGFEIIKKFPFYRLSN